MPITTTKLCAWTRGSNPAATPAAIIRRCERGKRVGSGSCHRFCFCFCFDFPRSSAGLASFSVASHQYVKAITASGRPIKKPRCGTSRVEIELPQRHVVSGITVNDGERSMIAPKSPPSFVFAWSNRSTQPRPPFNSTSNGVTIAASLSRNISSAQR